MGTVSSENFGYYTLFVLYQLNEQYLAILVCGLGTINGDLCDYAVETFVKHYKLKGHITTWRLET